MPFSAGKLAQCLIQGDSLRKQRRQGRESHNVSITLVGIIKGRRKITSERERNERCSRFSLKKNVVIIITTTIIKLLSRKKIQRNKGAPVKSKPLATCSTHLGLQENSNHKLVPFFRVPLSVTPKSLPIVAQLPAQQTWQAALPKEQLCPSLWATSQGTR